MSFPALIGFLLGSRVKDPKPGTWQARATPWVLRAFYWFVTIGLLAANQKTGERHMVNVVIGGIMAGGGVLGILAKVFPERAESLRMRLARPHKQARRDL